MKAEYSVEIYRKLEQEFYQTALHRPMQITRYEKGTELEYEITGVSENNTGKVRLVIEKFVGGGFAGQVYQVRILDVQNATGELSGIKTGNILAMKILIPPSSFSLLFRNVIYWIGFQGPFQLQVNPAAARSGAIWQKFIRRGAQIFFDDERAVVDIHATFVDNKLGSCGELSEWVEGRTWRLEVDENLDSLKRWSKGWSKGWGKGKAVDVNRLGSPEFRSKRVFMDKFVELLHEMGAPEFARQYEWSTWKSQPNCLKRNETEDSPTAGLSAVDFRAGLALLPFLPMSPGDFKLIWKGLLRGSLVQFDRGDVEKLEQFIQSNSDSFADLIPMLDELKSAENIYRSSIPDITHNHLKLLYSPKLWSNIFSGFVTSWKVRNFIDSDNENKMRKSKALTMTFYFLGIIPLLGKFIRRIWARPDYRRHYRGIFTNLQYFQRAVRGKLIEKIINWYRAGSISDKKAIKFKDQIGRCFYHLPLSILPSALHRFVSDWQYAKERLYFFAVRPIRLYFDKELRAQWLRDMVMEGKEKHILTNEDAEVIISQVKEKYIQKYLKSLAVHICTAPITQVVSVIVAAIYILTHPELPRAQAYAIGLSIIALFQVVPISPGSLARGLYVVYLVIKDRNFKDYNIAVFLGFFKYIGYLAFPIQMAYRYPAMARFMAGHWATDIVHIVPVFGERGALLEHRVFSIFYNTPLTVRRKMNERSVKRAEQKPRFWHVLPVTLIGVSILILADFTYFRMFGEMPGLKNIWPLTILLPLLCGSAVTLGAKGAAFGKCVTIGVFCGSAIGLLHPILSALLEITNSIGIAQITASCVWQVFIFTILSTIGVLSTEILLPAPKVIDN